jgi:arginyl-tRNA synthetase
VLTKAEQGWGYDPARLIYAIKNKEYELHDRELSVLRFMCKFPDYIRLAVEELSPNLICSYLFELAQRYNAFYNDVSILGAETEYSLELRLQITKKVMEVLDTGLWLLGIEAPEKV